MNSYTKHHILRFYNKYINRSFDQDDVAFFIVLARDYAPENSIFRELGHFLAHPDKKDRGILIKNYNEAVNIFEQNTENFFGHDWPDKINMKPIKGLGRIEEIQTSLYDVFRLVDLTPPMYNKNDLYFRDFIFCLIFLLSNFKLQINGKLHEMIVHYGHSVSLETSYESINHNRLYCNLPVIFLENVNTTMGLFNNDKKLKNHIVRRFDNGLLGAIPYEVHDKSPCKDMSVLRGICWPLPDHRSQENPVRHIS